MTFDRTYRRGDTGPVVTEIKVKLGVLGLLTGGNVVADPAAVEYDAATDQAVRTFQQQRGITVDGIVGPKTYQALEEARWRLGDRILAYVPARLMAGDDVAALQRRLLDLGFDCGRVDGLFGAETEHALRDFQRNVGIVPDGTCGPATFKALHLLTRTVVGGRPQAMRESEAINRAGPTLTGKLVIVDPGHGGSDSGVAGHGLDEAGIVYDLASRVEGRLAATGSTAFLTRGPDGDIDDVDRASFANAAGADLFISLHVDAHANPEAAGCATYYYGNDRLGHHSEVGESFAELVQKEVCARTDLTDCRTHPKTWDLLRRTRMPTVQIEVGYVTNRGDAARLTDPAFRDVVAEAIVAAVQRLYLPPGEDSGTGLLRIPALRA
ncbi:MAG: N-acetylmuramoyl-L-alanine amidase [Actinomycetota bacterium]|jgi:N-acetylmuramoyl-L-alanine amidase|nr:N-acetylmuramoyl-L-alanine amidase [Actinomycetota bacterium]